MTVTVLWYAAGRSLLDRLIRYFTNNSPYSHTALLVQDGTEARVYEELAHGIVRHDGSAALSVAAAAAAYKRLTVTDAQAQAAVALLEQLVNAHARYSVAQLLADALQKAGISVGIDRGNEMVCSGAVAVALTQAGYHFDQDPRTCTPGSLAVYFRPITLGAPL